MKIALVNANTIQPPLSPIGLLYLAAHLKAKSITVEIFDLCLETDIPAVLDRLAQGRPDLIGVSIRNIDSTQMKLDHYFLPGTLEIIKSLRLRCPRTPLVLGGAGFSLAPFDIMELSGADYGVVGEGERALHELAVRLSGNQDVSPVASLVYRDTQGRWHLNPPRNSDERWLEELPFQDLEAVNYRHYYESGGMASLQTKRGCALGCAYCTYPLIEGRSYRLLSPRRIVDEMEAFVDRGFTYFHFSDSVFNVPREHALAVCRQIIARALPVKWHAYMSPRGLDDEMAECLAAAGNDGVPLGIDSCSARMLQALGKDFGPPDIERAAAACRKQGLEFSFNILFGAPGETMNTAEESLRAIDDWRPTAAFLTQGIRIYRGTPLHQRLISEGKLDASMRLLEPHYYLSEELPPDFSDRIRAYALSRDFVYSDANAKSPSTNAEIVKLYRRGFRGPCWRVLRELSVS
ncbi:MAG: radical SAM protein [Elusimicrobia bacterium]|nr:radical SAM protein [Elusimicrobiota bacterium]